MFVFKGVLCGLPLPFTVLCPSRINAPKVAADTEFFFFGGGRGFLKCRRVMLPRDGLVTPFPEDKDDPCPGCLNFTGGTLSRCEVRS